MNINNDVVPHLILKLKNKNMENLQFIPNNILTNFFKELTKYKNNYQ